MRVSQFGFGSSKVTGDREKERKKETKNVKEG